MNAVTNSVYRELVKCASLRRTLIGSDLVKQYEIQETVNTVLDDISKFCIAQGLPVITCLVVQANTGLPSQAFFTKYTNLTCNARTSKRLLWKNLVEKVYECKSYPTTYK